MAETAERTNRVRFRGSVESRADASALIRNPGDYVIVERGRPRWLILRCPSRCGTELSINLDSRAGPAWCYYLRKKKLTLFPSIWLTTGCESHFIIWDDRILWCDGWEIEDQYAAVGDLETRIAGQLRSDVWTHFTEVAEELNEIPWNVLAAARRLKKRGRVLEKEGRDRGFFILNTT